MALTQETFRAVPDRKAAFTLTYYALKGQFNTFGQKLVTWLSAPRTTELDRLELLQAARTVRNDLDVLIAELEASSPAPANDRLAA